MLPNWKFIGGLVAALIIFGAGVWVGHTYFPAVSEPITITKEVFQEAPAKVIEKVLHVPTPVAQVIAKDMIDAKPTDKPVKDPDTQIKLVPSKPTDPVVQQYNIVYDRKFELGVGVGYHKEFYVPVEAQWNYAKDKGFAVELHLNPKVTGGEIKHIWRFK